MVSDHYLHENGKSTLYLNQSGTDDCKWNLYIHQSSSGGSKLLRTEGIDLYSLNAKLNHDHKCNKKWYKKMTCLTLYIMTVIIWVIVIIATSILQ
jgi:hypothetical protein